jgi:hypothetical protein
MFAVIQDAATTCGCSRARGTKQSAQPVQYDRLTCEMAFMGHAHVQLLHCTACLCECPKIMNTIRRWLNHKGGCHSGIGQREPREAHQPAHLATTSAAERCLRIQPTACTSLLGIGSSSSVAVNHQAGRSCRRCRCWPQLLLRARQPS